MWFLALLGFGGEGVIAGSLAALWQSTIGIVAAGSLFAGFQSLGATGGALLAAFFGLWNSPWKPPALNSHDDSTTVWLLQFTPSIWWEFLDELEALLLS
jgi:hypothetical protein